MKLKLRHFILPLLIWATFLSLPVYQAGCTNGGTTLQAGGVYTHAELAAVDQTVLDFSHLVDAIGQWYDANATVLSKYPDVGATVANVRLHRYEYERAVYAARDAYASALSDYETAKTSVPPDKAKLAGALSILKSITEQIIAYKAAHP